MLELRERLYAQPVKQVYSNAATIQRFAASFSLIDCERVAYSFRLDQPSLAALVQMTPLTWGPHRSSWHRRMSWRAERFPASLRFLLEENE